MMFLITNALINACADFVKPEEGLSLKPYVCPGGQKTIGYGHVIDGKIPSCITDAEANDLLVSDLQLFMKKISLIVEVELNQNQIIALTSFAYNVGIGAFSSSTLLKKLNAKAKPEDVAAEFNRWIHANNKVLPGLVKRREREAALFLTPVQSTQPKEIVIVKIPFFKKLFNFFTKKSV